jgi:GT2 family glycosyltransferase
MVFRRSFPGDNVRAPERRTMSRYSIPDNIIGSCSDIGTFHGCRGRVREPVSREQQDMEGTKMAVAIVNYNTREALETCLESLPRDRAYEVVVVDNGSLDGSVEMVRSRYPDILLDIDPSNPGYGAAANRAMALTHAPYLLLLNSDTILKSGTLEALRDHLDRHPRAAIVGPRTLNDDGSLQRSCFSFPNALRIFVGGSGLDGLISRMPWIRSRYLRTWSHDEVRSVPWVLGAGLALRRSAFEEVGGFREEFFMYMEETDLCYRAREKGWETHFTPAAEIIHTGGVSTRQMRVQMRLRYYSSLVRFRALHGGRTKARTMAAVLRLGALVKWMRDGFRLVRVATEGEERSRLEQDVEAWRHVVLRGIVADEDPAVTRGV